MNRNVAITDRMGITIIIICILLTFLLSGCITKGHPNLVLVEDSLSAAQTGDTLTISGQIKNMGNATAHDTKIKVHHSCEWASPGGRSWSIDYDRSQDLGDIDVNETVAFEVSGKGNLKNLKCIPSPGKTLKKERYAISIYSEEEFVSYECGKSFTRGLKEVNRVKE